MVANRPSANTAALWDAAARGLRHPDLEDIHARCLDPLEAGPDDLRLAHGIVIGTTENFGYMSGVVKDFFERVYYACEGETEGLPVVFYVRAGRDGTGTVRALSGIIQGMGWRLVQKPLVLHGAWRDSFCDEIEELATTLGAGMSAGLY